MKTRKASPKRTAPKEKKRVISDHARVDPTHCLVDGLFRPLFRGKTYGPLAVEYRFKEYIFHWQAPSLLGTNEQSVFLAILRLAATEHRRTCVGDDDESKLLEAWQSLNLQLEARKSTCFVIQSSVNELTRVIGRKVNGQSGNRILNTLERLAQVEFYIENSSHQVIFRCNMFSVILDGSSLLIGINPKLSQSLLTKKQATYIDMREQRVMKSDITKRLHVWLSCWVGVSGRKASVSLNKLIPHVWGDAAVGDLLHSRRKKLRESIAELGKFAGWSITLTNDDQVHVCINPVDSDAPIFLTEHTEMDDATCNYSDATNSQTGRNAQIAPANPLAVVG